MGEAKTPSPWADGLVPTIHCDVCNGLYSNAHEPCPVCGHQIDLSPARIEVEGVIHEIPAALQGAIPWSSFLLLRRMQEEWERPINSEPGGSSEIPPRFAFVILFWTFFEALMERFFEAAFADLPGGLSATLLSRFRGIGSRLGDLYKSRWGVTFWDDLSELGYPEVADYLRRIKNARNEFIHGDPDAIDEQLITNTYEMLLDVQRAWIALFNKRCTRMNRKVRIWEDARYRRLAGGSGA